MILKILSLLFLGFGVFVLVQVAMPFLAFKTWELVESGNSQLLVNPFPLSGNFGGGEDGVLGVSIESRNNFPALVSSKAFNGLPPYPDFKLSIPKLKMDNIRVVVNSNEFDQYLAHLPGTALPGEKGNSFITGHSSITRSFGTDKQVAFFASLPDIKIGDEVRVNAMGQNLIYKVVGMKVVDPKDVSVINPPDNQGRYMTLMTCVPPGFNTKRLVVITKLQGS